MSQPPDSDGLGVAVLGAGVIGCAHAATIAHLEGLRLVAVADTDRRRASELASRHHARACRRLDDLLGDPAVEAVAVCTPSGQHAEAVVAAVETGHHVVVEKPLDVTPEAVRQVIETSARSDRVVTVISQHRFDLASAAVRQAASTGQLGRLTSALVSVPWWRTPAYYDSAKWRGTWALDGGGAVMNQAIHFVDLLVWFLGRPLQVYARTARLAHTGIEVEDTAVATVVFESGALGVIHATTAAFPGLENRLQIHGDKGSAVIEADRLIWFHASAEGGGADYGDRPVANQAAEALAAAARARSNPGQADLGGGSTGTRDPALSDSHSAQYRDFLAAVRTGVPPLVTVQEAARTLSLVWALYESVRTGEPARPAM